MEKKLKLDPSKVEYDGKGFRVVIADMDAFREKLKRLKDEVLKDIQENNEESSDDSEDRRNVALPRQESAY